MSATAPTSKKHDNIVIDLSTRTLNASDREQLRPLDTNDNQQVDLTEIQTYLRANPKPNAVHSVLQRKVGNIYRDTLVKNGIYQLSAKDFKEAQKEAAEYLDTKLASILESHDYKFIHDLYDELYNESYPIICRGGDQYQALAYGFYLRARDQLEKSGDLAKLPSTSDGARQFVKLMKDAINSQSFSQFVSDQAVDPLQYPSRDLGIHPSKTVHIQRRVDKRTIELVQAVENYFYTRALYAYRFADPEKLAKAWDQVEKKLRPFRSQKWSSDLAKLPKQMDKMYEAYFNFRQKAEVFDKNLDEIQGVALENLTEERFELYKKLDKQSTDAEEKLREAMLPIVRLSHKISASFASKGVYIFIRSHFKPISGFFLNGGYLEQTIQYPALTSDSRHASQASDRYLHVSFIDDISDRFGNKTTHLGQTGYTTQQSVVFTSRFTGIARGMSRLKSHASHIWKQHTQDWSHKKKATLLTLGTAHHEMMHQWEKNEGHQATNKYLKELSANIGQIALSPDAIAQLTVSYELRTDDQGEFYSSSSAEATRNLLMLLAPMYGISPSISFQDWIQDLLSEIDNKTPDPEANQEILRTNLATIYLNLTGRKLAPIAQKNHNKVIHFHHPKEPIVPTNRLQVSERDRQEVRNELIAELKTIRKLCEQAISDNQLFVLPEGAHYIELKSEFLTYTATLSPEHVRKSGGFERSRFAIQLLKEAYSQCLSIKAISDKTNTEDRPEGQNDIYLAQLDFMISYLESASIDSESSDLTRLLQCEKS